MPKITTKYFFQKKKRSFAQKFFEKGLNTTSYILLGLKEIGKDFLRRLPNSYPGFELMKEMFGVNYKPNFKKETIRRNLNRLINQGLIAKDPKQKIYYLTEKGEEIVTYIKNRYLILKQHWDGKLRIVIFDIPEKKKYWREIIRQELLLLQFQQLQKSVYIGKHPIPESFLKEIEDNALGGYIFFFTIDKIDQKKKILELLEKE